MKDTSQLCGQCHGNLRFPNTDHLSYNIIAGTGGKGVPDQQMTANAACTDCNMYVSKVDSSNSTMLGGHTWAISVKEAAGTSATSGIHVIPVGRQLQPHRHFQGVIIPIPDEYVGFIQFQSE